MTRVSVFFLIVAGFLSAASAFVHPTTDFGVVTKKPCAKFPLHAAGNKKGGKEKIDLSYIESRDMTREEMLELNKKNEEIMNMELQAMTGFSLVISLPILYLCWVAFFSE